MQCNFQPGRTRVRRLMAGIAMALAVGAGACGKGGDDVTAPEAPALPGDPVQVPVLRQSAFVFDVDLRSRTVKVTGPQQPTLRGGQGREAGPAYSILSTDVIDVQASNFFASTVGAIQPNRVRVFFDVAILNKLGNVGLVTPTFPVAPSGQNGVILFPFSTNVLQTSGGIGANGNELVIELPSRGEVQPSPDWNGNGTPDRPDFPALPGAGGNPFNFFNDASCASVPPAGGVSDCFRYETFGPIPAGAASASRRVGFDIDASVGQFRARLIVAADLAPGAAPTGTIAGTLTSPERGPLAGVSVQISGLANPVVTDAAGAYSATVGIGPRTVTVLTATLPSGCGSAFVPANGQSVTVNAGATVTQNYSITCTVPTGTVNGTITRAGTGTQSLLGITVRINPDAGASPDITTGVTGTAGSVAYSAANVPVGTGNGAVTLENLPSDCAVTSPASGTGTYTGLVLGGTQTVNFTVTCDSVIPPAAYELRNQFGAVSGGTVDLTITFDPTTCDPVRNANCPADRSYAATGGITSLSGTAAGRITGRAAQPTALFGSATLGGTLPVTAWSSVTTQLGGAIDAQQIVIIRYTIGAGAAGSITTATTGIDFANEDGDPIVLVPLGQPGGNFRIIEATVAIP